MGNDLLCLSKQKKKNRYYSYVNSLGWQSLGIAEGCDYLARNVYEGFILAINRSVIYGKLFYTEHHLKFRKPINSQIFQIQSSSTTCLDEADKHKVKEWALEVHWTGVEQNPNTVFGKVEITCGLSLIRNLKYVLEWIFVYIMIQFKTS